MPLLPDPYFLGPDVVDDVKSHKLSMLNQSRLWHGYSSQLCEMSKEYFFPIFRTIQCSPLNKAYGSIGVRAHTELEGLAIADNPKHMFKSAASCRALFELWVDAQLLSKNPDDARKYLAYADADLYKSVKKIEAFHHDHKDFKSPIIASALKMAKDTKTLALYEYEIRKHWPRADGQAKAPSHWSALGGMPERVEECTEETRYHYATTYDYACSRIHGGPIPKGDWSAKGVLNSYINFNMVSHEFFEKIARIILVDLELDDLRLTLEKESIMVSFRFLKAWEKSQVCDLIMLGHPVLYEAARALAQASLRNLKA